MLFVIQLSVLMSLALAVLNSWLLIKMNTFKMHTFCRNNSLEGEPQQSKRVQTLGGLHVFNELFGILLEMRPLYKMRLVSW